MLALSLPDPDVPAEQLPQETPLEAPNWNQPRQALPHCLPSSHQIRHSDSPQTPVTIDISLNTPTLS